MEIHVTPHLTLRGKMRRTINQVQEHVTDPETGRLVITECLARRLGKNGLDNTTVDPSTDQAPTQELN